MNYEYRAVFINDTDHLFDKGKAATAFRCKEEFQKGISFPVKFIKRRVIKSLERTSVIWVFYAECDQRNENLLGYFWVSKKN